MGDPKRECNIGIARDEVVETLNRTKKGKAVKPDGIPVQVWNLEGSSRRMDLEKAYDTGSKQELWRCMREKWVPEKYVRLLKDMYEGAYTKIRTAVGWTENFPVTVSVHKCSSLSLYLFNLAIDVLPEKVREEVNALC
ncbi:uncharacterized protein [Diabrotica undecimpunctata]|uniref:uncharacterized protein n=1 Tax=Diabrotica undecimpunctata TaxID=50387 RepID=UPI003B63572E